MSDSTELDEDLCYLQNKHSVDSSFIQALTTSQHLAHKHIRSYKIVMYIVCPFFMLFGLMLIVLAFLLRMPNIGIFSGMAGAVMLYYFTNDFFKKQKAVKEIEGIASYHGLL